VLIGVHVIIAIHIIQWLITGMTVSPVEPSEAMETLELGSVNAGFVFFVLAIGSTFLFGRYFCGWGCHVVALQDLCSWMMRRMGVRPKPFRSRLLVLAPLALGLYMFVWPTFKRIALKPALTAASMDLPVWLRDVAPMKGFHAELIVSDFWATFPPWYVAIPFLAVVGFAAVYFLGSKGFCTYGCPYGGIFGVVDPVSPGRIVVNDDCNSCGHCTAVCTSNVRVHEEVRDFGMVVDPGCMKCMDCVSACPNDALGFAFAKPAMLAKPRDEAARQRRQKIKTNPKRFDLTWPQEVTLAILFIVLLQSFRGMLNVVPMLMAAGLAGIGVFLAWKLWCLAREPSVRLQRLQLKVKGRWRAAGAAFGVLATGVLISAAWGGFVGLDRWRAQIDYKRLDVPIEVALRPEFEPRPSVRDAAERGARLYRRSSPWTEAGVGWPLRPEDRRELAFFHLLARDHDAAEHQLRAVVRAGNPTHELIEQLAMVMQAQGAEPAAIRAMRRWALDLHPELAPLRTRVARDVIEAGGSPENAADLWTARLEQSSDPDPETLLEAARFFASIGERERALNLVDAATRSPRPEPAHELDAATLHQALGRSAPARSIARSLAGGDRWHALSNTQLRRLVVVLAQLGDERHATDLLEAARAERSDAIALHELAGRMALASGERARALDAFEAAGEEIDSPWALASVGETIVKAGLSARDREIGGLGLRTLERAMQAAPESPTIAHDLGQALLATGRFEEGLARLRNASRMAPENPALAEALAQAEQRVETLSPRPGPPR